MKHGAWWLLPLVAVLGAGCSDPADPVIPPSAEETSVATAYDPSLEPAAAVLSLVPEEATTLEVTDFDQLRLSLGFGALDSRSAAADRQRFWRDVQDVATLSAGMLRPYDARLAQVGLTQDDVSWEAQWAGGAEGWVIAVDERLPASVLRRAAGTGAGPLDGAVVDAERHLLLSDRPPDPTASWAADGSLASLVGAPANATYVERGCIGFDDLFGAGMEAQLAEAPRAELDTLDPLDAYSVSFGTDLATVRLGEDRSDAFTRLRIDEVLPQTTPEFGVVFSRGVADPSTGRIGYDLERPHDAVAMTTGRRLPFAVCAD